MTMNILFKTIFKVENAESYNKFLFRLQKIPLLGKKIPNRWFKSDDLKTIVLFLKIIYFLLKELLKSIVYIITCLLLSILMEAGLKQIGFESLSGFPMCLTFMLIFSILVSLWLYVKLITANDERQLTMIRLFRVEPRSYFKANELIEICKNLCFKGFVFGVFFLFNNFSFWHGLSFVLLISGIRLGVSMLCLFLSDRQQGQEKFEKYLTKCTVITFIVGVLLSLLIIGLGSHFSPFIFFSWYSGLSGGVMWLISYYILTIYPNINILAHQSLTYENMMEAVTVIDTLKVSEVEVEDKEIDLSNSKSNYFQDLDGIAYLNAIFMQRMGKHLGKSVRIRLLVLISIWLLSAIVLLFFRGNFSIPINETSFARLLFISVAVGYFFYIGESYMKFCFYHLDRPLLRFNDYRKRKVILAILKTRFVTSIQHNFSIFLVLSLVSLTFYFGWFDVTIDGLLILIVAQFVSMCFFSLYFLYLYFLLQPFTEGLESKSHIYNFLRYLVYLLGYRIFRLVSVITLPISVFILISMIGILFVGYWAVLKFAPKTFRLKV